MSLKPYWKKHPVQLRAAAFGIFITIPIWLLVFTAQAAWEGRQDFWAALKQCWRYMIKGGE